MRTRTPAVGRLHHARNVVLLDGPSGAGKSTLADRMIAGWPGSIRPQLVRLDDIYPGWDGLREAGEHVRRHVLEPLAHGAPARWQRFDWVQSAPAEWTPIDPERPLLIEGCGVMTRANAELADVRIWLDAPDELRKARALDRDGDSYAPHWDRWQAQWLRFVAEEGPAELADLRLDGSEPRS
ncbi:ATP-binding protein [Agreia sp. COWG]|uniref:ATP-binding protein n=1 Tax=Agreia sp. COWG TaxID=2773266 RepID=UPI0019261079|nr:ATP-binding protein [Agreia sp. COWG]CAD5995951.1 Uridine kinase [Agreia sp. COWG]